MYLKLAHASPLSYQRLKRRICIPCGGMMKLTCSEPDKPGFDLRTFECAHCARVESITVNLDPMASGGDGWAVSHLYSPS